MLDRIWKVHSRSDRHGAGSRPGSKHSGRQPLVEVLEGRQLLTASLAPIANFTVPAQMGYQLPLDGSGTTDTQTFTATSSNPDIKVSVAPQVSSGPQGPVLDHHRLAHAREQLRRHHQQRIDDVSALRRPDPTDGCSHRHADKRQLLYDCYPPGSSPAGPGKYFPRITSVSTSGVSVLQGGSSSPTSTASSSGITPIATEPVQQLAFTGQYQIAMANTGAAGQHRRAVLHHQRHSLAVLPAAFDYNYTIFGQLVSGQQTVTDLSKVAVQNNSSTSGQKESRSRSRRWSSTRSRSPRPIPMASCTLTQPGPLRDKQPRSR